MVVVIIASCDCLSPRVGPNSDELERRVGVVGVDDKTGLISERAVMEAGGPAATSNDEMHKPPPASAPFYLLITPPWFSGSASWH